MAKNAINSMHIFCVLTFLTLGIADALTTSIMIDKMGPNSQNNIIISSIYASHGSLMVIAAIISLTLLLITGAIAIYWRSNGRCYWMINGFLISLIIAGIMATITNLQACSGLPYNGSSKLGFLFLGLVFILVEAGDFVDKHSFTASNNSTI